MTSVSRSVSDASSSNAVDGNNDTNVLNGHCSLTDETGNYGTTWWRTRLSSASYIKSINIVSRNLCEFSCQVMTGCHYDFMKDSSKMFKPMV